MNNQEITPAEKKTLKIAQALLDKMQFPRGIAYDFSDQLIHRDSNNNFLINLFQENEGYAFIAIIDKNWYKVNKYKNDWKSSPQVIEQIKSLEKIAFDKTLQAYIVGLILPDFLFNHEGLENLIAINEIINDNNTIKDWAILTKPNETPVGKITITKTIFGKVYGYHENETLIYQTLENSNDLIPIYDILSVVGSYSSVNGIPKLNNAQDEAKYQNYLRGKEIVFQYYNDNK